ncbi:hypothetical protein jhhlp_005574 [Lomentospora prolificans]|uniref:Uncharacterized protein n=1 Tax=Lomentospora prolificans TaxID=41688 RepID=A0A2N3N3H7_9PEZI|nr:hypothetical protein jhhlp_005574 [Lomentospora prolificans]
MATQVYRSPSVASTSSAAPAYFPVAAGSYELTTLRTSSESASSAGLPPNYDDALSSGTVDPYTGPLSEAGKPFHPTQKLRIDCLGHPAFSLPVAPRADPIPIYDITHDPQVTRFTDPLYTSVRQARSSGNCQLVSGYAALDAAPLVSTTYRFGPGKPPLVTFHASQPSAAATQNPFASNPSLSGNVPTTRDEAAEEAEPDQEFSSSSASATFAIKSKSALHRTLIFRTHLGTFTWRYASRAERKLTGVNSLVILERVVPVAHAGSSKPTDTVVAEVARFVRSDDTRTPDTSRHTAGNGGVLLLDLRDWADSKDEVEEVRRLAVATCIVVMKKEVDRRRMQQMVTIAAVVGGS